MISQTLVEEIHRGTETRDRREKSRKRDSHRHIQRYTYRDQERKIETQRDRQTEGRRETERDPQRGFTYRNKGPPTKKKPGDDDPSASPAAATAAGFRELRRSGL